MKKIILALLLLLLIFIFPQSIGAQDLDKLQIFYYIVDDDGEDILNYYHISIPAWLCTQNRALIVFTEIFDNFNPDKMIYVPPGVRILNIIFCEYTAHLTINLSTEILNYGGTHFEYRLVNKLLKNTVSIHGVSYLTILIDSQHQYFPEGMEIFNFQLLTFNSQ